MNPPPQRPLFAFFFHVLTDVLDTILALLGCAMAATGTLFVLAFVWISLIMAWGFVKGLFK